MYTKNDIVRILMQRDGMTDVEAMYLVKEAQDEIDMLVEQGCGILEVEDVVADLLGLESDFLADFLL